MLHSFPLFVFVTLPSWYYKWFLPVGVDVSIKFNDILTYVQMLALQYDRN